MSNLNVTPVFKEISSVVSGQMFSTMYFGNHCGKRLAILKHEPTTLMLVFGNDGSFTPQFIKTVFFKGNLTKKAVEIVGSENVILLLDVEGNLWRLINALEFSNEREECLYLVDEGCSYEWIPFKAFHFKKVFALTAISKGFACVGINENLEKKLQVFSSNYSEDYTFNELNSGNSSIYYLTGLQVEDFKDNPKLSDEVLLVADRASGKTYICSGVAKNSLIYTSRIPLISTLNFKQEKCLLVCYQSGKLVFYFYAELSHQVTYLSKKLVLVNKCECENSTCILWSDGVDFHHTTIDFDTHIKLSETPVHPQVKGVMSYIPVYGGGIAVTLNNFYYHISGSGHSTEKKVQKEPDELLSDIYQSGLRIDSLNKRIEVVKDFLLHKEIIQRNDVALRVKLETEGRFLTIKNTMKEVFKKDYWKVQLLKVIEGKQLVKMEKLEMDLSEGVTVRLEAPFVDGSNVSVSLVGDYSEEFELLFVRLGEISGQSSSIAKEKKLLDLITSRRNPSDRSRGKQIYR